MKSITDPAGNIFSWKEIDHPDYKYEVTETYYVKLHFKSKDYVKSEFYDFCYNKSGWLVLKAGYRWDGASGPTIDTISTIRASAIHDAIYQMIREKKLSRDFKAAGDKELGIVMREDYHPKNWFQRWWSGVRASYYEQAVGMFGWVALRHM